MEPAGFERRGRSKGPFSPIYCKAKTSLRQGPLCSQPCWMGALPLPSWPDQTGVAPGRRRWEWQGPALINSWPWQSSDTEGKCSPSTGCSPRSRTSTAQPKTPLGLRHFALRTSHSTRFECPEKRSLYEKQLNHYAQMHQTFKHALNHTKKYPNHCHYSYQITGIL